MERQLGKPLHIQAAEAFESPAFLQKLGMARADAERIFGGADWHQLLRDLVPIRGRISCADALAAFRPLLDQVAPDPAEGWLSYAYQVARALLYPASDPGHTSAQWDGALCFLQLLQVLFDAERTCLPFDFWLDFEFCTEEELSHSGVAEEYRRFCYRFREEYIYEMLRLSREVTSFRTLEHIAGVHYVSMRVARAFCASGGLIDLGLISGAALGHDLGHTPFGHAGERALNRLCPGGFTHYRQSLRVVDFLEKDGRGLNLTWEVRNGIVTHTTGAWARTPEGCVVRRADHIAFLNHDIEDAVTAGVLDPRQLPPEAVAVLGTTKSQRITTMITDLIEHSQNGRINFSPEVDAAYAVLKDFMYSTVYVDKEAKREEKKVDKLVAELYERLCEEPTLMPNFYLQIAYNEGVDRAVTDYISGMSDEFATRLFEDLFVPQKWTVL